MDQFFLLQRAMKEIFLRVNQYLLFGVLLTIVLYYGRTILIPLVFGAMLAMLMAPVCRKLDAKGFHRALSCTLCIFILLVALVVMLLIVIAQGSLFAKDVPLIQEKVDELLNTVQAFVQDKFDISPEKQVTIVKKQVQTLGEHAGTFFGNFLNGLVTTVAGILLMLVYTFLLLYNKEKYEAFFLKLYKEEDAGEVRKIVRQVGEVSQHYLTGRVLSILILTALYAIGLLIVGIKNAIILACIAALLTIVPYIGSAVGGLFPFLMAIVTEDSYQPALWVAGVIIFIQAMDNYFIEPRIVGGEVNLNALATILIIIVGGIVWGVAGMILFIPMLGVVKIVCDHVEPLKPFGYLIGDNSGKEERPSAFKTWLLKKVGAAKKPHRNSAERDQTKRTAVNRRR